MPDMRRTSRSIIWAIVVLGFITASCGSDKNDSASATAVTTTASSTTTASLSTTTTTASTTTTTTASSTTTGSASSAAPATTHTVATSGPSPTSSSPASGVTGNITVFAAASLTESFTEIGKAFQTEYPDATVKFSFDASSTLVTQIAQGAPVDVFASADKANMTKLTDAGNNGAAPQTFAKNSLEIITGAGNPKKITGLSDLADPSLIVVTCGPDVPIGKYSAQVFTNAGVTVTPKSFEPNVKGVVNKVTLGEADAGIVYATDVLAAGSKAVGVVIPTNLNVIAEYPLVETKNAPNPTGAKAFTAFVLSSQGQKILGSFGFTAP